MTVDELTKRVAELEQAVVELRSSELQRSAEHATMVDELSRLYKRVATRIAREQLAGNGKQADESVLSLRNRLGKRGL